MNITGNLNKVCDEVVNNNFKSKEIWLDIPGRFPQQLTFQVSGGNINLFDRITPGSEVAIEFDITGRESNKNGITKRFNNLNAWGVKVITAAQPAPAPQQQPGGAYPAQQVPGQQAASGIGGQDDSDLPFNRPRYTPSLP